MRFTKITIVSMKKPQEDSINEELQWFGASLGLFGVRDKDKSCFRIFVELIKASKQDLLLTSDEMADRTGLTRGTVVHHLNKLMSSGIVTSEKGGYQLKVDNLGQLTDVVKENVDRAFVNLKSIAKNLDGKLGL